MLEDLDKVAWEDLEHAYGVATNIPDRIRMIASSRGAPQESAIDEFANEICHQGSAYSATVPCIRFICEIINKPRVPRRHKLAFLLLTIAVGPDAEMLHDGTGITDYVAQQQREAKNWPAKRKRPTSWGAVIWMDCYFGVQRVVPGLVSLIRDNNLLPM